MVSEVARLTMAERENERQGPARRGFVGGNLPAPGKLDIGADRNLEVEGTWAQMEKAMDQLRSGVQTIKKI